MKGNSINRRLKTHKTNSRQAPKRQSTGKKIAKFFCYNIVFFFSVLFISNQLLTDSKGFDKEFPVTPANMAVREFYVSKDQSPLLFSTFSTKNLNQQTIWVTYTSKQLIGFSPPVQVTQTNSQSPLYPSIAASQEHVFVVWQEEINNGNIAVRYCYSPLPDPEKNISFKWSNVIQLQLGSFLGLAFAGYDNRIHIFYHLKSEGLIKLYNIAIDDPSKNDYEAIALPSRSSASARGNFFPSVALINGNIYIAWQARLESSGGSALNDEIFLTSSKNNGRSWAALSQLTNNEYPDFSPQLFSLQDNPAIIYSAQAENLWRIEIIYYKGGILSGWQPPIAISHSKANAFRPQAYNLDNRLYTLWYDLREGTEAIYGQIIDINPELISGELSYVIQTQMAEEDTLFSNKGGKNQEPILFNLGKRLAVIWKRVTSGNGRIWMKMSDISAPKLNARASNHPSFAPYWSSQTEGKIIWDKPEDPSGIMGYAFLLSEKEDDIPSVMTHGADTTSLVYSNLKEGKNWAHIRMIDGFGNWGETSHIPLWVDLQGPQMTGINANIPKNTPTAEKNPSFQWGASGSGAYQYRVQLYQDNQIIHDKKISESKIFFSNQPPGTYLLKVTPLDGAGNPGPALEYPFLLFDDNQQPKAPLVQIMNLEKGFFLNNQGTLRFTVSPEQRPSAIVGIHLAISAAQFDIITYETFAPEESFAMPVMSNNQQLWLRAKTQYRDGRFSEEKSIPFFPSTEINFLETMYVAHDEKAKGLIIKSSQKISNLAIDYSLHSLRRTGRYQVAADSSQINELISYKRFPSGRYALDYRLRLNADIRLPVESFTFNAHTYQYIAKPKPKPKPIVKEEPKPVEVIAKNLPVAVVEPESDWLIALNNIQTSLQTLLQGQLEHKAPIIVASTSTSFFAGIMLYLLSASFKFVVDGLFFRIRWKLGLR